MLSPKEIEDKLQDRVNKKVAEETGLHVNVISNVKTGKYKNLPYETVRRLSEYFENN